MKIAGELIIFDLDDTLIRTRAKINVVNKKTGSIKISLTPAEFNTFSFNSSVYSLDFSEFECPQILSECTLVYKIFRKLEKAYKKGIPVAVLTARSSNLMVREFFLDLGIDIHPKLVIAINDPINGYIGSISEMKKKAIHDLIDAGFKKITFFDDNIENLEVAKEIEKTRKVKIKTIQVE